MAQEVIGYDEGEVARGHDEDPRHHHVEIVQRSEKLKAPTYKVADMLVEERLVAVRR